MPRSNTSRRSRGRGSSWTGNNSSIRGDSTPRSAPSGLRRGGIARNSKSSSRVFTTPEFSSRQDPSVLDDRPRNILRVPDGSQFVHDHSASEPHITSARHSLMSAVQSASAGAAGRSHEYQSTALVQQESETTDIVMENENEIIVAIDMRDQRTIGCAYYTACEEKLHLMQDCKFADLTLLDTRTSLVRPEWKLTF
jgi:hypothetical protein